MPGPDVLLTIALRAADPAAALAELGDVFAAFEDQDSGCVGYGVETDGTRWFVKFGLGGVAAAMLRSAAALHAAVRHPVILAPVAFQDADSRAGLAYPWCDGAVLYHPTVSRRVDRTDPAGPMSAFRAQPLDLVRRAVDDIFDAHLAVAAAGFVAVDLYDGCMLYDPDTTTMRLIDLDLYRRGPYTVGPELVSGSQRYLAPEERTVGATVDERTTVYTLGRVAAILMDAGDVEAAWRGSAAQAAVVRRATAADPAGRYGSVAEFVEAWHTA